MKSEHQKNNRQSRIILGLAIASSLFWWLSNTLDLYALALIGALFEILWLPMLLLIHIVPGIALILIFIKGLKWHANYILALLISGLTLASMYIFF